MINIQPVGNVPHNPIQLPGVHPPVAGAAPLVPDAIGEPHEPANLMQPPADEPGTPPEQIRRNPPDIRELDRVRAERRDERPVLEHQEVRGEVARMLLGAFNAAAALPAHGPIDHELVGLQDLVRQAEGEASSSASSQTRLSIPSEQALTPQSRRRS